MSAEQNGREEPQDSQRERVPLLADAQRDAEDPRQAKHRSTLFTVCPYILGTLDWGLPTS